MKISDMKNIRVCIGSASPALLRGCMKTKVRKGGKSQISAPEDN